MMRSNLSQEEFFQKMKKKPALLAILDRLDQYTVEDLETINNQPLWIREILVKMKTGTLDIKTQEEALAMAEVIASTMTKGYSGPPIIPKYEVKRWIGGNWLMPCGMTGGMSIEINPDDLFLIMYPSRHFITISCSYSTLDHSKWTYFLQNTIDVGIMTRTEYAKLVSDNLGRNFAAHEAIAKIAGPNSYVDPTQNKGFEIIRHPVK